MRPFWFIFHENEIFLTHFLQKGYLFGSFFTEIIPFCFIFHENETYLDHFHENDTFLAQFSLKWDLLRTPTITLATVAFPIFQIKSELFLICCNTVSTEENKAPIFNQK